MVLPLWSSEAERHPSIGSHRKLASLEDVWKKEQDIAVPFRCMYLSTQQHGSSTACSSSTLFSCPHLIDAYKLRVRAYRSFLAASGEVIAGRRRPCTWRVAHRTKLQHSIGVGSFVPEHDGQKTN